MAAAGGAGHPLEFNSIDNTNVLLSDNHQEASVPPDAESAASANVAAAAAAVRSSKIHVSVDFSAAKEESWTLIRGVKPATTYYCFVRAENEIGLSPASPRLQVQTEEEGTCMTLHPRDCTRSLSLSLSLASK